MTAYIVTFEVSDPTIKDNLTEKLKQFEGYCPIHAHCWVVLSNQEPADIYDFVTKGLGVSDKIFIIRSGTKAAWYTLGDPYDTWLKERL